MNRRNWLTAIVATLTGGLWWKKPGPPTSDYRPELLAGLFEVRKSLVDEGLRLSEAAGGLWGLDGTLERPPTAISKEEKEALAKERLKLEGKRELCGRLHDVMWSVIPNYAEQLRQFEGGSEEADRRDEQIRKQRIAKMRRGSPEKFREGGCFFATPQQKAEAKAWRREIAQKRLSNRRRLQALAKEKGLSA